VAKTISTKRFKTLSRNTNNERQQQQQQWQRQYQRQQQQQHQVQQQHHGSNINIVSSSRSSHSVINGNNNHVLWLIQKLQTTNRQQQLSQKFAKAFDAKTTKEKTTAAAATSTLATLLRVANYLVQRIFIIAQGKRRLSSCFFYILFRVYCRGRQIHVLGHLWLANRAAKFNGGYYILTGIVRT